MVLPRLIHPVDVELEQQDAGSTHYDRDAREPVQRVARKIKVTVPGQVKWGAFQDVDDYEAGPISDASGYVLFRYVDLTARSATVNKGDRITKIGQQERDLYINRLMPVGHYPDQGGAAMVKAFFSDRQPAVP